MKTRAFELWHSVLGTVALLVAECLVVRFVLMTGFDITVIFIGSIVGSVVTIYIATEVIEEVRGAFHMIMLLSAVVIQFVVFFAFQYLFLMLVQPASFPTLSLDALSLLLHSVMIFVFNPLYLPATSAGRGLLLVQTFCGLALAMFLLQNIGQFRRKSLDANK